VLVHAPDGEKTVKAAPTSYTTVRWSANALLNPGASERYAFEVTVK
jgi:hypothetical protein